MPLGGVGLEQRTDMFAGAGMLDQHTPEKAAPPHQDLHAGVQIPFRCKHNAHSIRAEHVVRPHIPSNADRKLAEHGGIGLVDLNTIERSWEDESGDSLLPRCKTPVSALCGL